MIKIDKSLFTEEELEQYEALIAKGTVDVPDDEGDVTDPEPTPTAGEEGTPTQKSAVSPELAAALARLETLEKSVEMKEFTEIAKGYAILGEKEDELAQTLYNMKKSDPANYDAYISVLNKQKTLIEKSGIFTEIGKSAHGGTSGGTAEDKIQTIAN